jgi:hypothetical protein
MHAPSTLWDFGYYAGLGVPQNYLRAYVWLSLAVAQGLPNQVRNGDLISRRDEVADLLTPEQLARGQDMATRCFESDYQDRTLSLWLILVT